MSVLNDGPDPEADGVLESGSVIHCGGWSIWTGR